MYAAQRRLGGLDLREALIFLQERRQGTSGPQPDLKVLDRLPVVTKRAI